VTRSYFRDTYNSGEAAGISHSSEFLTLTTSLTEGGVVFA